MGPWVDLPSRNAIKTILSLQHKGAVTVASMVRSLLVLDLYDSTLLTGCFLKSSSISKQGCIYLCSSICAVLMLSFRAYQYLPPPDNHENNADCCKHQHNHRHSNTCHYDSVIRRLRVITLARGSGCSRGSGHSKGSGYSRVSGYFRVSGYSRGSGYSRV